MRLRNNLRNKMIAGIASCALLVAAFSLRGQNPLQAQQNVPQNQRQIQATPLPQDIDPSDPALPAWMHSATPLAAATSTPAPGNDGEVTKKGGRFVYRQQVDEVTLQATVMDQKRHLVTTLASKDFVIYEDGRPQQITSFRREDIPVSIGMVVDNSGSMLLKRNAVTKSVMNLVQASNPDDEVFIVNFNEDPYLDQDFTNQIDLMREALEHVVARSFTRLYHAVIASADHLAQGARREKKVLLVITDGDDNGSLESLEETVRALQNDKGPIIYAIGLLSKEDKPRTAKRALEALSLQTGGVAFFPKSLEEVDEISREVARDIRNQYTITYKTTNPRTNGGYRTVRVEAHAPGYTNLQVRTRSGYFAGEPAKAVSTNR